MKVAVTALTGWGLVRSLARATVGKGDCYGPVSDDFKRSVLKAEHSPIRALLFRVDMVGIPYWVSVHLVRHKFGVEHYVSTQRSDRTGVNRDAKRQDDPVNHTMVANAQELMFMSRRRLCGMAAPETRRVWGLVVDALSKIDPVLAQFCTPMCVYRGGCPEAHGCGWHGPNGGRT